MAAEDTIPSHYVQGFRANLNLLPQQMNNRLLGCVDADLAYGEPGTSFNCDDIGASQPAPVTTRVPDSPAGFLEQTRRGGHFEAFADGKFIDNRDKARELADPSSKTMQSIMAGKNRFMEDKIIDGLFGTTYSGQNLTTANTFPAGQIIAVDSRENLHDAETVAASGNLGLTIGKIITASAILDRSELEGERYFGWTSYEKAQLLASTPATSGDYNTIKALANGQIDSFYGFRFVRTERMPVASSITKCGAWIKSAIEYKAREIITATITQRSDKSFRWYAYYETEHAVARRYDNAVVQVLCSRV
ncbi:phage capsid protein [Caulobacter sp. BK020]|uniref:phage capsid protein n=1 Tax=Caulobacter sp. BK020 TaxID=2512117 RepID=UPI0010429962|nr:phage capsid protein [Caulobacter sp. BK020]TCS14548.1 hypothetical protein EV278_107197 [Caulobacter sp. BK020]